MDPYKILASLSNNIDNLVESLDDNLSFSDLAIIYEKINLYQKLISIVSVYIDRKQINAINNG